MAIAESMAALALEPSEAQGVTQAEQVEQATGAGAAEASSPPMTPSPLPGSGGRGAAAEGRAGTSRTVTLRLMSDLRSIMEDAPNGVSAALEADDDLYRWRASVAGPEDTPWEGGIYGLKISFDGCDYPNKPPKVRFTCDIVHPNVYSDGSICMDTLKDNWKPVYTITILLQSIQSLLADPNPSSPANPEAARLLRDDPKAYRRAVRRCAERSIEVGFDEC